MWIVSHGIHSLTRQFYMEQQTNAKHVSVTMCANCDYMCIVLVQQGTMRSPTPFFIDLQALVFLYILITHRLTNHVDK